MANMVNTIYNIGIMDELSRKNTFIHRLHPLIKLITTVVFITAVLSFGRYEINRLLPFVFYPVIIFSAGEIPVMPIIKRLIVVLPFIIGIGVINLFFDREIIIAGGIEVYSGYITFLSIFIKCILTVTASILLIATTGMEKLGAALRMIKVPKIFVLQLLLTYRYISILIEEASTMNRAYMLRAPMQRGIEPKAWGSFAGQLLIRTYDRAERVYQSMTLRGFNGEYNTGEIEKVKIKDYLYIAIWCLFFILSRYVDIPYFIGTIFSEVII